MSGQTALAMSTHLTTSAGDATRRAAAERMRRSRTRRATGGVLVRFELSGEGFAVLVDLGWLGDAARRNAEAVQAAFERFVNAAAAAGLASGRRG
jgi:hypothetical protein